MLRTVLAVAVAILVSAPVLAEDETKSYDEIVQEMRQAFSQSAQVERSNRSLESSEENNNPNPALQLTFALQTGYVDGLGTVGISRDDAGTKIFFYPGRCTIGSFGEMGGCQRIASRVIKTSFIYSESNEESTKRRYDIKKNDNNPAVVNTFQLVLERSSSGAKATLLWQKNVGTRSAYRVATPMHISF